MTAMETVTLTAPSALASKLTIALQLVEQVRILRKLQEDVRLNPTQVNRNLARRAERKLDNALVVFTRIVILTAPSDSDSLVIKRVPTVTIEQSSE